jgi:predicted acylesterase/phospholipase RssA/CRP-like cAMP-binding protein
MASPLFDGLDAAALEAIAGQMRPRAFAAHEVICREGEPGTSLFIIRGGLARVEVARPGGTAQVALLRRGDSIGEMAFLTGEPRTATVTAMVPTTVLEMGQDTFAAVVGRYPTILVNLGRILSQRLDETNRRQVERRHGEAVAVLAGREGIRYVRDLVALTRAASPRPVHLLDLTETLPEERPDDASVVGVLGAIDRLLPAPATVLVIARPDDDGLALAEHMDRVLVLADPDEAHSVARTLADTGEPVELAVVGPSAQSEPEANAVPIVRRVDPASPRADLAWLGRHITRTKLGLALGAGGAKGYAHVGALHVLEEAGFTVDYVAGSSIGAIVGSWLALGRDAATIERTMREAFTEEKVAATFKLSLAGTSTGLDVMIEILKETTDEKSFADLLIPLTVMTVDLNSRLPAPLTQGPLWQALQAATALAGLFPPVERGGKRLVDGLALVPVPTGVVQAQADVTVSVNIMSRETLPAWPGQEPPEPAPAARARMLDTLLEVMDVGQLDASVRHAALADVPITPRFGPSSWRDFHLADLFLYAGRQAAMEQLPRLKSLAMPQFIHTGKGVMHDHRAVHA